MTSSTNMAPITIGGHTRWNSLSRGTGSSCADDAGTEGPIFDVRRRELVTLFGGGLAACRTITSSDRSWAGPGP
jgi:hypothetical protein